MTGSHIIYIPAVLVVGFVLGLILGRRAALTQVEARRDALRRRKALRKKRAAEAAAPPEPS